MFILVYIMPVAHHKVDTCTLDNKNKQNISLIKCKQRLANKLEKKNNQPLTTMNIRYYLNEPGNDKYYK